MTKTIISGSVAVQPSLSKEPFDGNYKLQIVAVDCGIPRLSSEVIIEVHLPANLAPSIVLSSLVMSVKEGLPVGSLVGRVDVQSHPGEKLKYSIYEANGTC